MSVRVRALTGVVVMSALLALYLVYAAMRAIALFQTGTLIAVTMGVALLVLPMIGVWVLVRELSFGRSSTRLVDQLEAQDMLPEEDFDTLPSGRPVREQADAVFPLYRAEVELNEGSWQAWMRLGIMYDASGDRKRARAAIRKAITLEKAADR